MTRDDIEQEIYQRTREFVSSRVQDAIAELIAAEREASAEYAAALAEAGWSAGSIADALRARGEERAEIAAPARRAVTGQTNAPTPEGYHAGLERAAEICDAYGMPDGTSPTAQLLAATIRAEVKR